jgi:CheY-like chemotaxis protein
MHALIIEDQPFIATLIEMHLRDVGYRSFDYAVTEAEAIAAARARSPDLITSDVRLAEGCGIAAVRAICADRAVSVVFITTSILEVGAQLPDAVVLAKPFGPADLKRAVQRAEAPARQDGPVPPNPASSL